MGDHRGATPSARPRAAQTQQLLVSVGARRVAGLANTGSVFNLGLRVQVNGDAVHAWVPSGSRSSPPHFSGRTDQSTGRTVILGAVHEAWIEANFTRIWPSLVVWAVLIGAFGVVTLAGGDRVGLAPLLIGIFGTVGFAGLAALSASQRGPWSDDKYEELDDELNQWASAP